MLYLLLLYLIPAVFTANMLILNPLIGHSHVRFLGNIANLLADDGHNVTVLSLVLDSSIPPFGTKHPAIHKLVYHSPYLDENMWKQMNLKSPDFWATPESDGLTFQWSDWEIYTSGLRSLYKGLLEDEKVMQSLRESYFDMGVTEIHELGGIGLFELLNIRSTIVASAFGMIEYHYSITGLTQITSTTPDWATTFGEDMTFMERLINMKTNYEFGRLNRKDTDLINELYRQYKPNMPDLMEVVKAKTGVILANVNEFTESPRSQSNMIQYVGGTNVYPPKPVDEGIDAILSQRPLNVLFSFGTYVNTCHIPLNVKKEIIAAFAEFPNVTFLWKYDKCEGEEVEFTDHLNVVLRPWWPQSDLLGDDRLHAFITHAGMNSVCEVAFRGKPSIVVPMFGDQYINAKNFVNRGLSVLIKRTELNKATLVDALRKVLAGNSSFAKKATLAAAVLKGKDEEYRKSILRWTRLLLEFGPMEHLSLPSKNLSFIQLFGIDCLLFITAVFTFSLFLGFIVVRTIVSLFKKPQKGKTE